MRPLSRGWNKCQYLDISWVLHACRAQSLASPQDSNAFPSLACTVWNIRHASMQKKDAVALLQHADKPSGKIAAGKPTTLRLLVPALTPHPQIKEEALPACKRGLAKAELSQPFSTGKLKHLKNAISVRRVYERRRRKEI